MATPANIQSQLVSIIIPTYNRATLLQSCLASARAQTHPHTEIIVVDDGSTDDTAARMKETPGVQFHRQRNAGPSAARNLGLQFARGKFIAFLDSDDLWSPDFLAQSLRGLAATGAGFAFSNWQDVDAQDKILCPNKFITRLYLAQNSSPTTEGWHTLTTAQARDLFIRHSTAQPTAVVLHRDCIPPTGWDAQARIGEDQLFLLDVLFASGCTVAFTHQVLWSYRIHDTNAYVGNSNLDKIAAGNIYSKNQILAKHAAALTASQKQILRRAIASEHFDWGWHESQKGDQPAARRHFAQSFRLHPQVKSLLAAAKTLLR